MKITGFVSLPACCRGSRGYQFFFVNGRQVRSKLMTAALEEAYKNQRMVGKFPGCVLHLETKLNAVDVNVHPAKTEVKFGQERQVFSAVYHGVLSALEGDRSHPQAVLAGAPGPLAQSRGMSANPGPAAVQISTPPAPTKPEGPFRPAVPSVLRVSDVASSPRPAARPAVPAPPVRAEASRAVFPPQAPREELPLPAVKEKAPPAQKAEEPIQQKEAPLLPPAPAWRVAGEVLNTYIIVEQGESVFLIDKHAAHERMNFDRMKAEGYDPMAQALLTPAICRLSAQEQEVLLAHQALLEEFGFEVDQLSHDLAVRQAPFDVDAADIPATLEELAQKLLSTGQVNPAAARDGVLHTMACKAAIKGGWKTSPQELERVARAVMEGQVKYCPHGRPVAIELTKKELEKQFKRA